MAPVCGATGVRGSAAGCKREGGGGGWVVGGFSLRGTNQTLQQVKQKRTPLVSVMSGQSRSVLGPGIEQAASGEKMSSHPGLCC